MTLEIVISKTLEYFEDESLEAGKLFLPSEADSRIMKSLVRYYDRYRSIELLKECIDRYIVIASDPLSLEDFATQSASIREGIELDKESKKEFRRVAEETRKKMEGR